MDFDGTGLIPVETSPKPTGIVWESDRIRRDSVIECFDLGRLKDNFEIELEKTPRHKKKQIDSALYFFDENNIKKISSLMSMSFFCWLDQ